MKKTILLMALAMGGLCLTVGAQNSNTADDFVHPDIKAQRTDFTTELGLAGGVDNTNFNLNEGSNGLLRFRYFLRNDLALRLGFSVGSQHNRNNFYDLTGNNQGKDVQNSTDILLNFGIEKHFEGTKRLSPYVGGDLLMGLGVTKETMTNTNGSSYVAGFDQQIKGPNYYNIGARAVVGADYYIAKHLYLGAEAGLGFLFQFDGKTKTTTNGTTTIAKSDGNSMLLNPSVITGVRIGFVF